MKICGWKVSKNFEEVQVLLKGTVGATFSAMHTRRVKSCSNVKAAAIYASREISLNLKLLITPSLLKTWLRYWITVHPFSLSFHLTVKHRKMKIWGRVSQQHISNVAPAVVPGVKGKKRKACWIQSRVCANEALSLLFWSQNECDELCAEI